MCAIFGLYAKQLTVSACFLEQSIFLSRHRGPDDVGTWHDNNIGLGHARLSIHDLSQAGKQPMLSVCKQWVLVFNGEIYNYLALKSELLKEVNINFVSHSDTEVLVNAIAHWGIEKTLKKCIGMFAFAAYHIASKTLYLARDRFGEKPLYYGKQNKVFAFASELKCLKTLKQFGWGFEVDRDVLATYMRYGYVPTPYCIYKNINKLESGCYLEINLRGICKSIAYWQASDVLANNKFTGSYEQAVNCLEQQLKESIQLQMAADVPLGAFLSGGIDSSAIVAIMQSLSTNKINTFSIGFTDAAYNEAPYASEVAKYLGTNHTEMYVNEQDTLNVIPKLPNIYDEPFGDSSQIPTFLVSKIAKAQVTVSLSGDAGDELFGGYNRYMLAEKIQAKFLNRKILKLLLARLPLWLKKLAGTSSKYNLFFDKIFKLQQIVSCAHNSDRDLYRMICSQNYITEFVVAAKEKDMFAKKYIDCINTLSYQQWMMFADSKTYMIDDILTKIDRAAMAVSLEPRVPFLDHRIFDFAWSLPLEYKIHKGVGKRVLRDVLYRYVPKKLIERPKMGFGVPIAQWLRGELKDWAASLLNPALIKQQGYLDSDYVSKLWREHQAGKRNWQAALWPILMFQTWLISER